MADSTIGNLTENTTITGTEELAIEKSDQNFKNTFDDLKTYIIDAITKTDVGLGNADNTSDANKPVSIATQTALDLKADNNTLVVLTTAGDLPNDLKDKTINLDAGLDQILTFTTTTFSRVGDICQFSRVGDGYALFDVGVGVVFNLDDLDGISTSQFSKKGAMRIEDVGGDVVIDLY